MLSPSPKVGGYLKHYCTKCGLDLGHTIVAMRGAHPARIRCDTCRTERNFRAPKSTKEILSRPTGGVARPRLQSGDAYNKLLRDQAAATPKNYSPAETFRVNDIVQHPNFGKGVVTKVIFPNRMDVLFSEGAKTLMCKVEALT